MGRAVEKGEVIINLSIAKMAVFPTLSYRFNLCEIPADVLTESDTLITEIDMEVPGTQDCQNNLEKKNKQS